MDLWAFDDVDAQDAPLVEEPPKPSRTGIPSARGTDGTAEVKPRKPDPEDAELPRPPAPASDSVTVNINKKGGRTGSRKPLPEPTSTSSHSVPGRDFEDLDSWEDEPSESGPEVPLKTLREISAPVEPEEVKSAPEPETRLAPPPVAEPGDDREEFSPKARADAGQTLVRPKLNLTKVERAGLLALLALLVIGGGLFYFNTIRRLPTGAERTKEHDFPIKGGKISVNSAVTYWRAPVTTGDHPDTVRRDTLLIPVVDLTTSGGPSVLRIFFRDKDGELVGDAVSRSIRGDMEFQVAATAGFDDLGMHAAYRTGQDRPWTIEILEGPSENAPTGDFKKLFEMNITTDRR